MSLHITVDIGEIADLEDRIDRGISRGIDAISARTHDLFKSTTATWHHSVAFQVQKAGNTHEHSVFTTDARYIGVNDGTKKRTIEAKNARFLAFHATFIPKTAPGVIGAGSGGVSGPVIFRKRVKHPGIKDRKFNDAIARKVEAEDAEPLMARAIVEELVR